MITHLHPVVVSKSSWADRSVVLALALALAAAACEGKTAAVAGSDIGAEETAAPDGQIADSADYDALTADTGTPDAIGKDSAVPDTTGPDLPVACTQDKDCTLPTPCMTGTCVAGACTYAPNTAACDDGNACTANDACNDGQCKGTSSVDCDDGNICTKDACDLATGCTHTDANGLACDDGQKCSALDQCSNGKCLGVVAQCADDNLCTDDTCLDGQGCVHLPSAATCDDGNPCTANDACKAGNCAPGSMTSCDDGNPCTTDSAT